MLFSEQMGNSKSSIRVFKTFEWKAGDWYTDLPFPYLLESGKDPYSQNQLPIIQFSDD